MSYTREPMKRAFCAGVFILGLWPAFPVLSQQNPAEAERDLTELRERIEVLERKVSRERGRRSKAERELQDAETSEAEVRRSIAKLAAEQDKTRTRRMDLKSQEAETRVELAAQMDTLSQQLRLAYFAGQEQWLRLVLSQQDSTAIGRQTVYYSYLTRQRRQAVEAVQVNLATLEITTVKLIEEEQRLSELGTRERSRLKELSAARDERAGALARIDEDIQSGSGEIDQLRQQAVELEALVAELTRLLIELPVGDQTPFGAAKGRLAWPTEGTLIKDYGQSRADGRLRWDGVLLGTDAGSDVRAVHSGQVVFADWLTGMGLLLIVDHGDGYISLYGHNQDVLKDVGEWVVAGEVIGHVGDSGGQTDPGLYFEIRKNGQPVNPHSWISK
jgi:septal ring factor EnvC (AmiA/AmiB activator)